MKKRNAFSKIELQRIDEPATRIQAIWVSTAIPQRASFPSTAPMIWIVASIWSTSKTPKTISARRAHATAERWCATSTAISTLATSNLSTQRQAGFPKIENSPDKKEFWGNTMRENARKDYDRMESLHRCDWNYIGIKARAEIVIGDVCQTITSGGLWGHRIRIPENPISARRSKSSYAPYAGSCTSWDSPGGPLQPQ